MRRGKTMMESKKPESNHFMLVKDTSTIFLLFEKTYGAFLAVLSFTMEQTEDNMIANLCL